MEVRRDSGRLIWGVVLLVLGLLLLLNNFGYGWWFGWGRWWPLALIALGVWMFYRREAPFAPPASKADEGAATGPTPAAPTVTARRRFPTGAYLLIGIGLAFLLENVIGGNAFPALVLIAIGVVLLLRGRAQ